MHHTPHSRAPAMWIAMTQKQAKVAQENQGPRSSSHTSTGARKSVVASIEPRELKIERVFSETHQEFRRSPAPSPPSREEKGEYEHQKTRAKAKSKHKAAR